MKIGIVIGQIASRPAGLERYALDLITSLVVSESPHQFIFYLRKGKEIGSLDNLSRRPNVKIVYVGGGLWWKDWGIFWAEKAETYLYLGPIASLFYRPRRNIVIAYDLAYRTLGTSGFRNRLQLHLNNFLYWRTFCLAEKIICISRATRDEILKFLPSLPLANLDVIYPGFNSVCRLSPREIKLPWPQFFLFVGTVKNRKNVFNIVKAFAGIRKEGANSLGLVIVGRVDKNGFYYRQIDNFIKEKNLTESVIFLGHISDEELSFLYQRAIALVYPSLVEGFGFPVIEAKDCLLPVITSNYGALKEISGQSSLLVDPHDFKDIALAMTKVESNLIDRATLVKKGKEETQDFSWPVTAKEIIKTLENLG